MEEIRLSRRESSKVQWHLCLRWCPNAGSCRLGGINGGGGGHGDGCGDGGGDDTRSIWIHGV